MKKSVKNIGIGLGIIMMLLIITNPGIRRFKEYTGNRTYAGLRREQNWIIFSVYSEGDDKYLGIILNFFKLKP